MGLMNNIFKLIYKQLFEKIKFVNLDNVKIHINFR